MGAALPLLLPARASAGSGKDGAFTPGAQEGPKLAMSRGGQAPRRAQNPFATAVKKLLTEVPTNAAQPTTTIEMNTAIRAYSIDVAPERPIRNGINATRIRSIIIVILESVPRLPTLPVCLARIGPPSPRAAP